MEKSTSTLKSPLWTSKNPVLHVNANISHLSDLKSSSGTSVFCTTLSTRPTPTHTRAIFPCFLCQVTKTSVWHPSCQKPPEIADDLPSKHLIQLIFKLLRQLICCCCCWCHFHLNVAICTCHGTDACMCVVLRVWGMRSCAWVVSAMTSCDPFI